MLPQFILFDDLLKINKQDYLHDLIKELISNGYEDDLWGSYFELSDEELDTYDESLLKTMPQITEEDPEATFAYCSGNPTGLLLLKSDAYLNELGLDEEEKDMYFNDIEESLKEDYDVMIDDLRFDTKQFLNKLFYRLPEIKVTDIPNKYYIIEFSLPGDSIYSKLSLTDLKRELRKKYGFSKVSSSRFSHPRLTQGNIAYTIYCYPTELNEKTWGKPAKVTTKGGDELEITLGDIEVKDSNLKEDVDKDVVFNEWFTIKPNRDIAITFPIDWEDNEGTVLIDADDIQEKAIKYYGNKYLDKKYDDPLTLITELDKEPDFYDLDNDFWKFVNEKFLDQSEREDERAEANYYDYKEDQWRDEKDKYEEDLNEKLDFEGPNYGHRAWILNQIISSMNDETAYYDTEWLYTWPDGETEKECDDDFGDEESFKDLEETFISIYKYNSAEEEGCDPEDAEYNFHRDGLYNPTKEAVQVAHEYDKQLGLEPIKVLGNVKECVDDVRFIREGIIKNVWTDILDDENNFSDIQVDLPKLDQGNIDAQKNSIRRSMGMDDDQYANTLNNLHGRDRAAHILDTVVAVSAMDPIKNLSRLTAGIKAYFESHNIPVKVEHSFYDTYIYIGDNKRYEVYIRPLKANKLDVALSGHRGDYNHSWRNVIRSNKNYTLILNELINLIRKWEFNKLQNNKNYQQKVDSFDTSEFNTTQRDIDKMNYYRNKGSDPDRLANSIKDEHKLISRLMLAANMGWEEAVEAFKDRLRYDFNKPEEMIDAYIQKGRNLNIGESLTEDLFNPEEAAEGKITKIDFDYEYEECDYSYSGDIEYSGALNVSLFINSKKYNGYIPFLLGTDYSYRFDGKYYPQTRWEPAEYPELELKIKDITLDNVKFYISDFEVTEPKDIDDDKYEMIRDLLDSHEDELKQFIVDNQKELISRIEDKMYNDDDLYSDLYSASSDYDGD